VYVPVVGTVIDAVVSSLLHNKEPMKSEAVNTELSQLFVTVTVGAAGIIFGAATPLAGELLQPFTLWVTVYIPAPDMVMEDEVDPLLHSNEPVKSEAVSNELPQLSITMIVGVAGIVFGEAIPLPSELVQPFTV
jgi:multisubunit Na+/H+ antiporter MnhB subunit